MKDRPLSISRQGVMPCLLTGMVSVRGRTPEMGDSVPNRRSDTYFTEHLAFLKIISLAEISKQSCSKLKYAVCIYIYTLQIRVRSFGYQKKKKIQAECIDLTEKNRLRWIQLDFEVLFLVLFNKTVYLSL